MEIDKEIDKESLDQADELIETMSTPRTDLPPSGPESVYTDYDGRSFDPDLHVTNDDGTPVLTSKNKLKKKRTRKKRPDPELFSSIGGINDAATGLAGQEASTADVKAAGMATAGIIFTLGIAIGGPDWQPTRSEQTYMSDAWRQYFEAKNIRDLPPGVVVAVALLSYAAPRFTKPETKSRLARVKLWFAGKFAKRGKQNGTRADNRDDGKRENDRRDAALERL